jgi:hypothetical protein
MVPEMHVPGSPRNLVQKLEAGLHWKASKITSAMLKMITVNNTAQIVAFWYLFTHIWSRKNPMVAFIIAVVMT